MRDHAATVVPSGATATSGAFESVAVSVCGGSHDGAAAAGRAHASKRSRRAR